MYKAPAGRIETIHQALGPDLRNLPMPEPSERVAGALMRAVQDVATMLQEGERTQPPFHHRKGGY